MTSNEQRESTGGLAELVDNLMGTLQQERSMLDDLQQSFNQQIEAMRSHQLETIEHATHATNDLVNQMHSTRLVRERQLRLLGRILKLSPEESSIARIAQALETHEDGDKLGQQLLDERDQIREKAAEAQKRCEELEFSLNYAVQLGREMLEAVKGLDVPAPTRVYTASGETTQTTSPRSLLNRLG